MDAEAGREPLALPYHPRVILASIRRLLPGVLIGVGLFVLLTAFVGADPANGATRSSSPWSDEGFNTIGAHNLVLLGRFSTDDWNLWLLNLPFTLAVAFVFKVFGAGIVQARMLMIVATAATAALLAIGLRRAFGTWPAAVAAIAFATCDLTLFYGRLVYLEDLQVLALVIGALTLVRVEYGAPWRLGILAGLAFAVSIGTKPNAVFAVVGLLVFVAVAYARGPVAVRRWVLGAALAIVGCGAAWGLLVALPNLDALRADLRILNPITFPSSIHVLLENVRSWPDTGGDQPIRAIGVLLAAAAAGVLVAAVRRRQIDPVAARLLVASLGWFLVPIVVLIVVDYRPNRYLYPLTPALAILAAPAVAAIVEWTAPRLRYGRPLAALAIAAILAAQGLLMYAHWATEATYTLARIQSDARAAVPADSVVVGPDAPTFLMAAPVVVIVPQWGGPPPVNTQDFYTTRGARWYITNEGANAQPIATQHPDAWARRVAVFCADWFHGSLCIYRLP